MDRSYLIDALDYYASETEQIGGIFHAGHLPAPPPLAYQVHFPRVEMVLIGEMEMEVGSENGLESRHTMKAGDILYVPAESWNKPYWQKPVVTMSILVGKQSFGMSLLSWDGQQFDATIKENIARRGPRTGTFILQAIEEIAWQTDNKQTQRLLMRTLCSHILHLINHPAITYSKSKTLFDAVREYLEQNYHEPLTRESVAEHFYVSPNYLSQLFNKEGKFKFNEYLNYIRLERAKYLLKEYDMKVKEVAHRCGFSDSNYFCRVFRNQTARSPSQYRIQYHSNTKGSENPN
ncbi:helix-turn-helix domain-containing protein [Vibrio scophthalmi]|uniref:Putative HTH-type transcriptional regulator YijO n=1 Tax=Vibrio scophthalmi TaxID=45658 RepID=A0A1E3WF99_9VIBR|nr:AraC family transcriptional regulator [Vibrio scophthalmi]ODS04430.1 putative HTH-type transcriptional regulator YijO [Vibrio scophthalmi]